MHGPQSYEGSGGESSGDEEDLDRFFFQIKIFPKVWYHIRVDLHNSREVQRSLCGLGRNSRNTPGLGTKPTREDNSRTNPHFENLTSNPSFENSRSNSSSESTLGSNLLQVQGNLGSQSSFHSAVTRQVTWSWSSLSLQLKLIVRVPPAKQTPPPYWASRAPQRLRTQATRAASTAREHCRGLELKVPAASLTWAWVAGAL